MTACGDDNSGETTDTPTTVPPATTTVPATESATDSATDSGTGSASMTSEPTGGSDSQTSNGPGSSVTETTDNTTNPLTSTDPTLTSTGPDTISDPSTDPSGTSTSDTSTTGDTSTTSDGTTTSDDTTTSGEVTTEDIPCNVVMATLTPIPPNIMLVLDKSGSMINNKWDHDADPNTPTITRWASLHAVVSAVVNNFDNAINFGANLFPSKTATDAYDANACKVQANVEVPVKANNGTPIINTIPPANTMTIKGGTPASTGMKVALDHLKTLDPTVPRAILFITDGAANCGEGLMGSALFEQYDMTLHTIVENALQVDNIPTYVVGIDISTQLSPNTQDGNPNGIVPFDKLNDVAIKGGKPKNNPTEKFYQSNNQIELDAALDAIIADAISCEIAIAEPPAKPELTEVEISGVEVPFVPTCNGMNGWTWVNPNGPYDSLILCGTACTELKQVGKADVNFFCMPG